MSKQQYLAAKNMAVVPHPHFLHLAPCDFFLFMRIKLQVLGSKFPDVPEIWEQLLTAQLAVPAVLQAMAEMLDLLHILRRGVP